APVRTMQRCLAGAALISPKNARRSRPIWVFIALATSGRLSVKSSKPSPQSATRAVSYSRSIRRSPPRVLPAATIALHGGLAEISLVFHERRNPNRPVVGPHDCAPRNPRDRSARPDARGARRPDLALPDGGDQG